MYLKIIRRVVDTAVNLYASSSNQAVPVIHRKLAALGKPLLTLDSPANANMGAMGAMVVAPARNFQT